MQGAKGSGHRAAEARGLAAALRDIRDAVLPLRSRIASADRAADLLERDLLPRTAGGMAHLVCGIVGPNNAGKSALFNSLIGRAVSPSLPAGGATRRLVGAAHPQLIELLRSDPALARFRLRPSTEAEVVRREALEPSLDPTELLIVSQPELPPGLMLIDTPDFDSILEDNRIASESLLAVADVVIAVVTRHSYQNRDVVRFLERWFDHGRPWMLVYNEAIDEQVARAHAAKLIAQLGQPPLAVFWAPHSLAVQSGQTPLIARRLPPDGEIVERTLPIDSAGPDLRSLLLDLDQVAEVKSRAFDAALARLQDHLRSLIAFLEREAAAARELVRAAEEHAAATGARVAFAAMPAGPFIEAFRTVLDRRTHVLSRGWRALVRGARAQVESMLAVLRGRSLPDARATEVATLCEAERNELRKAWPFFWENVERDLGSEARHPARLDCSVEIQALLDRDLGHARTEQALANALEGLGRESGDLDSFRNACEELVEHAMDERGFDLDIQTLADLATVAPLALAAAVVVKTGGIGVDLAVAGGGAASTFLMEKYSHLLGSGIVAAARRRWTAIRGARIADALVPAALPGAAPAVRATAENDASSARALAVLADRLRLCRRGANG